MYPLRDSNSHTLRPQILSLRCLPIPTKGHLLAVRTRLELATPCVTGMYSNQLNYRTYVIKVGFEPTGIYGNDAYDLPKPSSTYLCHRLSLPMTISRHYDSALRCATPTPLDLHAKGRDCLFNILQIICICNNCSQDRIRTCIGERSLHVDGTYTIVLRIAILRCITNFAT